MTNQISVENNVIEAEIAELHGAQQMEDAVTELSLTQLALVGGGSGSIIL